MNYWAVLVAGAVSFLIGGLWYSPVLFGNLWMKLIGMNPEDADKSGMGKRFGMAFLSALLMSFVVERVFYSMKVYLLDEAIAVVVVLWLGFIATTNLGKVLWENKPVKLYFLDCGYYLVSLISMATILNLWR